MTNMLTSAVGPQNEPVNDYRPGSAERMSLETCLSRMASEQAEIASVIDGERIRTGNVQAVTMPHDKEHVIANCHVAATNELVAAVRSARNAKADWERASWRDRSAIFERAAELLAGPYRDRMNASTMLGQSKNAHEAEIDAACEFIDFLKFNNYFYEQVLQQQPGSSRGVRNSMEYRPLEGFVAAISPFNFSSIAGNLPALPALLGNTVVWKPAETQIFSASVTMDLLEEAGLPPGVINMVTSNGPLAGEVLLNQKDLAGVHFTGSTATFETLYETIGRNISRYSSYPRLVGEAGGKNFVFAHPSADPGALVTALIRGAFEYQGQKCSAASRAYIPKSLWQNIRERLADQIKTIRIGDVRDFSNYVNAVIDERSFTKINGYLEHARKHSDAEILVGGSATSEQGYFIEPTVIVTSNPSYLSMREEIFGPVLSVFVYEDSRLDETLEICDSSTRFGLTGAVMAQDRMAAAEIADRLRFAAGNFYINDKPTGAVIGQQPFGGSRKSGTNDKAGSQMSLYPWLSPRTVKENFLPATAYPYPFMA